MTGENSILNVFNQSWILEPAVETALLVMPLPHSESLKIESAWGAIKLLSLAHRRSLTVTRVNSVAMEDMQTKFFNGVKRKDSLLKSAWSIMESKMNVNLIT